MNSNVSCVVILLILHVVAARPVIHQSSGYDDLTDDYTCPQENHQTQTQAFPNWNYALTAPDRQPQPIPLAWEPILEPEPGCNGLGSGWTKTFSFLVVLDASWIHHYNQNSQGFSEQGYGSLEQSPFIVIDRVSYLFQKQFGVTIKASQVVSFDTLGEACATNNKNVDDGTYETSTSQHLAAAGITSSNGNAGILRLGIGSLSGTYCHSYASVGSICNKDAVFVVQRKTFAPNGSQKLYYDAAKTLAHEIGHLFNICPNQTPHCLNSHTVNELPDIMVWDGTFATNARPQGLFRKFFTACTPIYNDKLCTKVKQVSSSCGVHTPSVDITGEYFASEYGSNANDWHYVTITMTQAPSNYLWTNRAGVSWTLTRDSADDELFQVDPNNPYYSNGYTTSRVVTVIKEGVRTPTGIYGPSYELYTKTS